MDLVVFTESVVYTIRFDSQERWYNGGVVLIFISIYLTVKDVPVSTS